MYHNSLQIEAMQTVLKNPKLRKSILIGLDAPVGSTKRTQAQKVVNSIYSLKLNHHQRQIPMDPMADQQPNEGQGGGIDENQGQQPSPNFMGTVDLPTVSLKPSPKTFNFRQQLNMKPPSYNGYAPVADKIGGAAGMFGGRGGALDGNTTFGSNSLLSSFSNLNFGNSMSTPSSLPLNLTNTTPPPATPATQPTTGAPPPATDTSTAPTPGSTGFIGPLAPGETAPGSTSGTTGSSTSYTPSGDPLVDYLHQAVSQSVGANAFATKVMNDKAMYQELFPGVPVDQLPIGASLTDQIQSLYNRLSDENNLTQLNSSLINAQQQGVNLKDDAQAYIQGKDTYLNQIDGMLNDAQTKYGTDPMSSDPWYASTMQNYINYLTVLRGRTTQRYINYVNATVDYQNSQITNLQNQYNAAATKVQNLFNSEEQITVQQYNDTKQTLVDMYNNLGQQSALTDTSSEAYQKALGTQLDNQKKILALNAITPAKQTQITTQVTAAKSLEEALNDPVLASNNIPIDVIADAYVKASITKQRSALSHDPSAFAGLYNSTQAEIGKVSNQIQILTQEYQQTKDPQTLQAIQKWQGVLTAYKPFDNLYNQALQDYIGGTSAYTTSSGTAVPATPSKLNDVQNALGDMAQAIAGGKVKSYEQWASMRAGFFWHTTKAGYYSKIDPSILKLLFNTALARVQEYAYDQQTGGSSKISLNFKNLPASQIADSIYYAIPSSGIAGASSNIDLSQYNPSPSNNTGSININLTTPDTTIDTGSLSP